MKEDKLDKLAAVFKIFSDKTRIRIMSTLLDRELSVGDIVKELSMEQSAISHQLRLLKDAKLVKSKKVGRLSLYSLDDDHVKNILEMGLNHVCE